MSNYTACPNALDTIAYGTTETFPVHSLLLFGNMFENILRLAWSYLRGGVEGRWPLSTPCRHARGSGPRPQTE